MDLEEQTLRYYLSLFSVIIFLFYSYYIVHFQFLFNDKHIIKIAKGDSISKISEKINKEIQKLNETIDLAEDLFKKELLDL